ncbi:hypothetical protein ACVIU7_005832 [Bradyrhizobium liaoningense]|nr:hypothetical protein GCM10007858_38750 [Bradyrhizobium liaoningense]
MACEVPLPLRSGKRVAAREFRPHVLYMKQSDIFRDNADNCLQLAERAEGQPAHKRYSRMADAWTALANEQDWLDGEVPPVAVDARPKRKA